MFERSKKDPADAGKSADSGRDSDRETHGWTQGSTPAASAHGRSDIAVIGRSIRINGDLCGEEDLRIEGNVTGTVQLKNNTLTIGSEGKLSANVYAKSVTVDGLMEGDIFGSERVNIRKNATVNGNITAPRVSLEDGAKFKGSIEMDPAAIEKTLGVKVEEKAAMSAPTKSTQQSNGGARHEKPAVSPQKNSPKAGALS